MSLLPQRKKSPEEIAQLRESLGIPAFPAAEQPTPPPASNEADASPAVRQTPVPQQAEPSAIHPAPAHADPMPVLSLEGTEQILLVEEGQPAVEEPAVPVLSVKPVSSLRKSEQVASRRATRLAPAPADSKLPIRRHSDDEIEKIRRQEVLAGHTPVVNPKLVPAHTAVIVLGYVAVLAGGVSAALTPVTTTAVTDLHWIRVFGYALAVDARAITIPSCCVAFALFVAAGIVLFRPFSRHHAAFITVITLFVIVFSALHSFPQLRHGT